MPRLFELFTFFERPNISKSRIWFAVPFLMSPGKCFFPCWIKISTPEPHTFGITNFSFFPCSNWWHHRDDVQQECYWRYVSKSPDSVRIRLFANFVQKISPRVSHESKSRKHGKGRFYIYFDVLKRAISLKDFLKI